MSETPTPAPDPSDEGGHWPTPEEWTDRFLALTRAEQVAKAEAILSTAQAAESCATHHSRLTFLVERAQAITSDALPAAQQWSEVVAHGDDGPLRAATPVLASLLDTMAATVSRS